MWEDSCPAFLADKRLGQTSGLLEAWTRVQVSLDAANQAREKPLWGGFKCPGWETTRDKFFRIMEAFSEEAPRRTGDRGEHSKSTASSRERSALLSRPLDDWTRALKACNHSKDMCTAEKEADRLQAEKKRQFVNTMSTSRRLNMYEASGQFGDEGTFTTPGGDAATEYFVQRGTRNKKAKTSAFDPAALQQAAREASEKREAHNERRHVESIAAGQRQHAETIEEARAAREQDAGFRWEAIDLEKRKVEAGKRQAAEINEVKQDLAGVKDTVGELAQTVERQGEKQAQDSEKIMAMLVHMAQAQTRRE